MNTPHAPHYFEDATGERWRVRDAIYRNWKPHLVPLSDPCANTRYFVSQSGERRAYTFQRRDSRALDVETLAQHFAGAGWVGPDRFDPASR